MDWANLVEYQLGKNVMSPIMEIQVGLFLPLVCDVRREFRNGVVSCWPVDFALGCNDM